MQKIRILVADDHAILRAGLTALLNVQSDMEVIGEADTGKEACRQAQELQPDIVVMDVSMPEMNGAQATEALKHYCPTAKVVALTAHEDQAYLHKLLRAGANGYVLKRAVTEELTRAIRSVAGGNTYVDPILAGKALVRPQYTERGEAAPLNLSEREEEVMRLVAQGYTNKEIAERIYISVKTVETYKARIMQKTHLKTRADIVRYAISNGWLQDS